MKSTPNKPTLLLTILRNRIGAFWYFAVCFCACVSYHASAQQDNFDDGNDNGWVRGDILTTLGGPTAISFPDGPFGKGYRIQCSSSVPLLQACGDCGTARILLYHTNV